MNYDRLENLTMRRAERYRVAAYVFFVLCLATLLLGVVPAMYYGSGWWVLASVIAAGIFFFLAFFAGGVGWSRFHAGERTPESSARMLETHDARLEDPYSFKAQPLTPPQDESARPFIPPEASDQSRPAE